MLRSSRSPCRPPFRILLRGGRGNHRDDFSQGRRSRPWEEGGATQISCRRGLAGGRAGGRRNGRGWARTRRPFSGNAADRRGPEARGAGGARARASAYKRAALALPRPRRAPPPRRWCSVCAPPLNEIDSLGSARICQGRADRSVRGDFPPPRSAPTPDPPSRPSLPCLAFLPGTRKYKYGLVSSR